MSGSRIIEFECRRHDEHRNRGIIIIIIIGLIASHEDGMNDIYNDKSVHVMK